MPVSKLRRDSLGSVPVPADAYFGAQTQRAKDNFDVSGDTLGDFPDYLAALGMVKKAAALANADIGVLPRPVADAIAGAADELIADDFRRDDFPVDMLNAGGGVSVNMNVNEVLAERAGELMTGRRDSAAVHAIDHVNAGQSTSDVVATAISIVLYRRIQALIDVTAEFEAVLAAKQAEYADVVKLSRTCLQDAVPITFGQELGAHVAAVRRAVSRLADAADSCLDVPMGGTVVGTSIGVGAGYIEAVHGRLREATGLPLRRHPNFFDAFSNGAVFQDVSAAFKGLALSLSKLARDLRLLSSGTRAGLSEVVLPAVQAGSSFMPGKINPVIPEMVIQIGFQVCGNDLVVTLAIEGAELDFNAWTAVMTKNLFESSDLLTRAIPLFRRKCLEGLVVDAEVGSRNAERSLALSSIVAGVRGYEAGMRAAGHAARTDGTIRDAVVALGILSDHDADRLLDPLGATDGVRAAGLMSADHGGRLGFRAGGGRLSWTTATSSSGSRS